MFRPGPSEAERQIDWERRRRLTKPASASQSLQRPVGVCTIL